MAESVKKKSNKAVRIVGIVLAVLLVIAAGFTAASHAVWLRSDMATAAELLFRIQGAKKKFSDPQECADYIEQRRARLVTAGQADFVLPVDGYIHVQPRRRKL